MMASHRHLEPYAALVLDGSYDEMSADGRFSCGAGVLIVHPSWHAHANTFGNSGAIVLNLPAPAADGLSAVQVPDPDAIAKIALRNPEEAGMAAVEESHTCPPVAPAPWLARLAALLGTDQDSDISELATRCGVSPEHASRACKRWFGLGPAGLRREGRLRTAIELLVQGARPAEAALAAGFSDQPHLTRLLKRATGYTPARFSQR